MKPLGLAAGLLLACSVAESELQAQLLSVGGAPSSTTDSIVQLVAEPDGLTLMSPDVTPTDNATFWMGTADNVTAPFPFLPLRYQGAPTCEIVEHVFLVDGSGGLVNVQALDASITAEALQIVAAQVENAIAQTQTAAANHQMHAMTADAPVMDAGMMTADESGGGSFTPAFGFSTDSLWLQINGVSNAVAYLALNNATDQVYAILSSTGLTVTNWNIEPGVLFPTDSSAMPFAVPVLGRTNALFIRAMDWTGVTHDGNQTPDWWFWKYFQTLNLSDNDIGANGNALLYDYTNGIAPNDVGRPLTLLSTISVAIPVDITWMGNLYVLSGSAATLTEFNTSGSAIRSLSSLGSNPSGFDVDSSGNVYVASTGNHQVWKFNPTTSSFAADTNFGFGGFIGDTNGATGSDTNEFNAPFDVAVSPDGGTISVSDSGNNRIQQFSTNGTFIAAFGSPGGDVGQFNMPKGLTYDSTGNLIIADSGNNRIVSAQGSTVLGVSGMSGTAFGQFNAPAGVGVNERGIYVADTGNNRIQCFNPLANGVYGFTTTDTRFVLSTNLSQPRAVAAVDNLTNEMFYVADTGNNRVLLYGFPTDDPTPTWINMTTRVAVGDISGAVSYFSAASANDYQNMFLSAGTNNVISAMSEIGALTPVYIYDEQAKYYFTNTIDGQTFMFPVKFVKENGVWKILEF